MIKIFKRIFNQFKEYIVLLVLSIISLTILSLNEKPEVKQIKIFALGNFSVVNDLVNSIVVVFKEDNALEELRQENARLMLEVNKLRKKSYENDELRAMLGYKDTSRYPLIPVKVISKLVTKIQGYYIINKGVNEEVKKGMPVLNHLGLVGLVSDAAENYSVLKTLFNTDLSIAVTIQRTNIDGILSFDGKELVIKNIPTTYDVKVGDLIETSNFSSIFPPSIPVGVIEKKGSNALGLLHNLTVKPFADVAAVNNLFVVKILPSREINKLEMNLLK